MAEETVSIPTPPRLIPGDEQRGLPAFVEWAWGLVDALDLRSEAQSVIEPGVLPDPATSTVATAQNTANQAFILGFNALALANQLDEADVDKGQLTVSGVATTAVHTFDEAQDDTDYYVALSASASTGAPLVDAYVIKGVAKTTAGFTITVFAAPGGGNDVTFDFHATR